MRSQQKRKRKSLLEGWRRFVVSSFVVRQLLAESNKNGTQIEYKWNQSGPGGGGATENQLKYEEVKKTQA